MTTVATVADCHTRPLLLLDEPRQTVHVLATAPSVDGCPHSGTPGTIYDKTASMDNPSFAGGRGTPVIRDASSANMNDATGTKQSITADSGIVVLASNNETKRYWHADLTSPAPTASFTASATSGQAPLPVQFTDTSTGTPTSWLWNFGDGSTATTRNPAHTYTTAGTYTVTLTATNATGDSTPASTTITVTPAPVTPTTITTGASSFTTSSTAATAVTVARPDGTRAGDLLVAQITADQSPAMGTVPPGWTTVLSSMKVNSGARVFAYWHQVSDLATEPASYTWQLAAAQKFGAGITAFSGVDPVTPFDTAVSSMVDGTYTAAALTVPGTTTVTDGAVLIGGVGLDNATTTTTAPTGWTTTWVSTGGQVAAMAVGPIRAAGPTGDITWTFNRIVSSLGCNLRPAPGQPRPPRGADRVVHGVGHQRAGTAAGPVHRHLHRHTHLLAVELRRRQHRHHPKPGEQLRPRRAPTPSP